MKKKIVKEFIRKIWNEGDIDAASDFIAATYTIHHDPGDPWEGMTLDLAGFQDRVRKSRQPVPDQQFILQEMFENEASVAITWLWQGTHLGNIANFPPSGKKIQMSGATVYYFEDDRITGHWQIVDRLGVFQQLQQASLRKEK
ncbi:MAG: ester cyclase [Anaerolineae bacterium]|nr:ester cyclase [Anaerolineae bacterium]